jgi:cell wall-associated NlpC family hydrolase
MNRRLPVILLIGAAALLLMSLATIPLMFGSNILFMGGGNNGTSCTNTNGDSSQPGQSSAAGGIPANYLSLYKAAGAKYGIPWNVLAGIGTVETDNGQSNLPGVHSGTNYAGAAGPMQFEAATFAIYGVAVDTPTPNIYDPADAIYSAANYLKRLGAPAQTETAIFGYNHSAQYVALVLSWAQRYSNGNFSVVQTTTVSCTTLKNQGTTPNSAVGAVLDYAKAQLGKPYIWGGTGPDGFDCSGLAMMAYRAAGITIPRLANYQYFDEPKIPNGQEEPGDLVFFAGSDGTLTDPGHVGIVYNVQQHLMLVAPHTGTDIQIQNYVMAGQVDGFVGFTRPWETHGKTGA